MILATLDIVILVILLMHYLFHCLPVFDGDGESAMERALQSPERSYIGRSRYLSGVPHFLRFLWEVMKQ